MARLSLVPQKREFFDLYNRAAENNIAIAARLAELLERFPDGAEDLGRGVKELEHERARLVLPRDAVVVEHLRALQLDLVGKLRRLAAAICLEIRDLQRQREPGYRRPRTP